jgi:hypothetical protein
MVVQGVNLQNNCPFATLFHAWRGNKYEKISSIPDTARSIGVTEWVNSIKNGIKNDDS